MMRRYNHELAVNGIAQSVALSVAGQGIEKKSLARVRKFQLPILAAIGGFVDARFICFSARHQEGVLGVERHNAPKIERVAPGHMETLPRFAEIVRMKNHAVRAASPHGNVFCSV